MVGAYGLYGRYGSFGGWVVDAASTVAEAMPRTSFIVVPPALATEMAWQWTTAEVKHKLVGVEKEVAEEEAKKKAEEAAKLTVTGSQSDDPATDPAAGRPPTPPWVWGLGALGLVGAVAFLTRRPKRRRRGRR